MTVEQLRESIGLKPGQLLTSAGGLTGDILAIEGDNVVIGVLESGRQVKCHITNFITREQAVKLGYCGKGESHV